MAESGSKSKGAFAGVGILAALGGVVARSADDCAMAGCRATRTATLAGEGVTAGKVARTGSELADDGLRGVGRAGLRHADDIRPGRPWMIAAGEGDDGLRMVPGSNLDDIATRRGASVAELPAESLEGSSPGEAVLDLTLDAVDLSVDAFSDPEPEPRAVHLPGPIGLAATSTVRAPHAVLIQTWADDADGSAGVPQPASVARVDGASVAQRGWLSVLRVLPQANPLVVLGSSRDGGGTIQLGTGSRTRVSDLHAQCTSAGRHCVTVLCRVEQDEPSPCMASLPDIFDRTVRAASAGPPTQDAFVSMLGRARSTWDATLEADIAYVKVTWEGGKDGSFHPSLTKLGPLSKP